MDKYQVVKFVDDDFTLDVRADADNETVWLTQESIALLFDRDQGVISRHINNIFREGELDKILLCKKCIKVKMKAIQIIGHLSITTWM